MSACFDAAFDHPVGVVFFFVAHFKFSVWVFDYNTFENWFYVVFVGVWGVDGVYGVPESVPISGVVLACEDDVIGEFDSEVDWVVGWVRVPPCFFCFDGVVERVVSFLVCCAEEVFSVSD